MSLTRQQSTFTYASSTGGQTYYFDIEVDAQGLISVANIRSARGPVTDVPESVMDDIQTAIDQVGQVVSETQVASGNIVFEGETYKDVTIGAGVLNNTAYRVVYSPPDGMAFKTLNKTTTGFRADAGVPYGSVLDPKTVGYVVLVSTQQTSATSGILTFTDADGGQKAVTFAQTFDTDTYRVIFSEGGFFKSRVLPGTKAKTGFTVELGYTLPAGGSVEVGYDVFL